WYDDSPGGNNLGSNHNYTTPSLSNTTTYYVEAFNGTCPSNRVAVNAVINTIPSVSLGNDTAVFSGPLLLDAGAGYSTYLWSTGETTQTITVQASNNYCVTITDSNNCTNSDCMLADFFIGIRENELKGVNIYPNPTNGI